MPPQNLSPNAEPHHAAERVSLSAVLSMAPELRRARLREIFLSFGIPLEAHEEYRAILQGHLEVALDGYLAHWKQDRGAVSHPAKDVTPQQ